MNRFFNLKTSITYKAILFAALPIVLESLAQNILNITDTAFMGRVGETSLAAAAIATVFYFIFIMIAFGLAIGSQIIIARRLGENELNLIGKTFRQTQYLLVLLSLTLFLTMKFFLPSMLEHIVSDEHIREKVFAYMDIRIWGFFPAFLNSSFRAFFVGTLRTRVITYTTLLMVSLNILMNYVLIFGHWGFPKMGIGGAALASVIAESSACLLFFLYTSHKQFSKYKIHFWFKIDFQLLKRILIISFPLMMQYFVSLSCWFVFFLFIERMGQLELAVSNIIRSMYIFMLLPIWGFSAITNSLTSQLIGQGKSHEVWGLIFKSILLCLPFAIGISIIIALLPEHAIALMTNDERIASHTVPVLYVILGASPLLAISYIIFSALTGSGKTHISLLIESCVLLIYIILAYLFAMHLHFPIAAVWTVEYVYSFVLGILSFLYLRYGRWKENIV
jgi:putative MATE family efflux protein